MIYLEKQLLSEMCSSPKGTERVWVELCNSCVLRKKIAKRGKEELEGEESMFMVRQDFYESDYFASALRSCLKHMAVCSLSPVYLI